MGSRDFLGTRIPLTLAPGEERSSAWYSTSLIQAGPRAGKEEEGEKAPPQSWEGPGKEAGASGEEEPMTADSLAKWPSSRETRNMEPKEV